MKMRIFWKVKKIKILIQKVYFDFEKKKKLKFLQDKAQKKALLTELHWVLQYYSRVQEIGTVQGKIKGLEHTMLESWTLMAK